jgi:hypothetical protein
MSPSKGGTQTTGSKLSVNASDEVAIDIKEIGNKAVASQAIEQNKQAKMEHSPVSRTDFGDQLKLALKLINHGQKTVEKVDRLYNDYASQLKIASSAASENHEGFTTEKFTKSFVNEYVAEQQRKDEAKATSRQNGWEVKKNGEDNVDSAASTTDRQSNEGRVAKLVKNFEQKNPSSTGKSRRNS